MWHRWFERQWQYNGWVQCLLLPLSWLFALLTGLRRWLYQLGIFPSKKLSVPVIVVGNISVGGVGKTPLVIYLAQELRAAGYVPGVLSRGYGGQQTGEVTAAGNPNQYGDEPVLIAQRSMCPVWVHPRRVEGGQDLLRANTQINVLISDDGLQHYAMRRDIEIAVVQRPNGLGNGHLLPAGPLRESVMRLNQVDLIVETGQIPETKFIQPCFQQHLQIGEWISVADFSTKTTTEWLSQQSLLAIAGIGHPDRFFNLIKGMGLISEVRVFADHYAYSTADFSHMKHKTILMTEKDAVKCRHLNLTDAWFLPVSAELTPIGHQQAFIDCVIGLLQQCEGKQK